jgi:hypothetical protein
MRIRKSNWQRTVDRANHRYRLAKIFANGGDPEDILNHPIAKGRLAAFDDDDEIADDVTQVEEPGGSDDELDLPPELEQAIAALLAANPMLTRQQAAHALLHTARGRALYAHLTKRHEDTSMSTPTYESILKDFGGLQAVCKRITTTGDASGITEAQLTKLAEVEAQKIRKSNETLAQAFSRYYQSEEALPLRKSMMLCRGLNFGTAKSQGF